MTNGTTPRLTLAHVAVAAGAIALSLLGFGMALRLPGGQGIEDLLGWTRLESIKAAVGHWRGNPPQAAEWMRPETWHFEATYVLLDTALFMPLYGVLLLLCAQRVSQALTSASSRPGRWIAWYLWPASLAAVTALLVVDAVENHGGALRIGAGGGLHAAALGSGALLAMALWASVAGPPGPTRRLALHAGWLAAVLGAVLVGAGTFGDLGPACAGAMKDGKCHPAGATAHGLKAGATLLAAAVVAAGALVWLFGAELRRPRPGRHGMVPPDEAAAIAEAARRAAIRHGIAAIVWRTRYVLVALALFAALTLGLDQCRDVLMALAAPRAGAGGWRALVAVATALAVGLFVYATWLWARLSCRMRRLRDGSPPAASPESDDPLQPVHDWLGEFARVWARALSIVPLLCVYLLVALAMSDTVAAAGAAAAQAGGSGARFTGTMQWLAAFGALAVGTGVAFLALRSHLALTYAEDYYNATDDLYGLLRDDDAHPPRRRRDLAPTRRQDPTPSGMHLLSRWLARALRVVTPRSLPLIALGAMLLLRAWMAAVPEPAAAAPAALAIVALALVWWLGVFGALGLAETAHGRPYLLLVIAGVGAMGLFGTGGNHVLPLHLPEGHAAALAALRWHGVALATVLAALAAVPWLLFTREPAAWRLPPRLARGGAREARFRLGARTVAVLLSALAGLAAVRLADRLPLPEGHAGEDALERRDERSRLEPGDAVQRWARQLPAVDPGGDEVFVVASEGGGIRSAYWTAQVLRTMRALQPQFDRRTFVLSGVSGGAMGIAAYTACVRTLAPALGAAEADEALGACLDLGFGRLDALSPLLAAWMFEDALARVLPSPMAASAAAPGWACKAPGCRHLSRAQGFERAWMHAFPAMAQPMSGVRGGEPHLLLNGTWIESGELASVSSLVVRHDGFPGARDVQARLGAELSLVGAAHVAARFPFVNPLAGVQPARGAPLAPEWPAASASAAGGEVVGHLGDGGYFDNSASIALAPVVRALARGGVIGSSRRLVWLVIRNGKLPPRCEEQPPDGPDPLCLAPVQEPLTPPTELGRTTTSRNWNLYADVLGPAVAVLNVSGIGAHGRHAAAELQAQLLASQPEAMVWVADQRADGPLAPLGWYLSPLARAAMDVQAACLAEALGLAPGVGRREPCPRRDAR